MSLVAAKCTQCGANIEVDATQEAGICKYCGTAFITEKAINHYNINNTYNIQNANIVLPSKNIENLRKLGYEEYRNGKYESADDYYKQILEVDGDDYDGIFGRKLCLLNTKAPSLNKFNIMSESLKMYLSKLDNDNMLSLEQKNDRLKFSCAEYERFMNEYNLLMKRQNFVGEKVKATSSHVLMCDVLCQNYFKILDILEPYLEKYECLNEIWNFNCRQLEKVMIFVVTPKVTIANNVNKKNYLNQEDLNRIYSQARKLRTYALKCNSNYSLPSKLISSVNGLKCPKCGKELRIIEEKSAVDVNNNPVYQKFGCCDKCMTKRELSLICNETNKNTNFVSIIAVILAVLGLLSICLVIGIIPCLISIALCFIPQLKVKEKKVLFISSLVCNCITIITFIVCIISVWSGN